MQVFIHKKLDASSHTVALERQCLAFAEGRFEGVRKMREGPFWRARLDDRARLLFAFIRRAGQTAVYLFELLPRHNYHQSHFLRAGQWTFDDFTPWQRPNASSVETPAQTAVQTTKANPRLYLAPPYADKLSPVMEALRRVAGRVFFVAPRPAALQVLREAFDAWGLENLQARFFLPEDLLNAEGQPLADATTWLQWQNRQAQARKVDAALFFEEWTQILKGRNGKLIDLASYQTADFTSYFEPAMRSEVHALAQAYARHLAAENLLDVHDCARKKSPDFRCDLLILWDLEAYSPVVLRYLLRLCRHHAPYWAVATKQKNSLEKLALQKGPEPILYRLAAEPLKAWQSELWAWYEAKPRALQLSKNPVSLHLRHELSDWQGPIVVLQEAQRSEAAQAFPKAWVLSLEDAREMEFESFLLWQALSPHHKTWQNYLAQGLDSEAALWQASRLLEALSLSTRELYWLEAYGETHFWAAWNLVEAQEPKALPTSEAQGLSMRRQARLLRLPLGRALPPWEVWPLSDYRAWRRRALQLDNYDKQAKDALFRWALLTGRPWLLLALAQAGYVRARRPFEALQQEVLGPYLADYREAEPRNLQAWLLPYGPNFRLPTSQTPLMLAAYCGSEGLCRQLLGLGASLQLRDADGRSALDWLVFAYRQKQMELKTYRRLWSMLLPRPLRLYLYGQQLLLEPDQPAYWLALVGLSLSQACFVYAARHDMEIGLKAAHIQEVLGPLLAEFPQELAWLRQTPRTLAAHCVGSAKAWHRQLFIRVARGRYLLNPFLDLAWEGESPRNLYRDTLLLEQLREVDTPTLRQFVYDFEKVYRF